MHDEVAALRQGAGVFLHDPAGDERGGYDFIGTDKAVMTLDRPTGEGAAAIVDDRQGFAGLAVLHPSPLGRYRYARRARPVSPRATAVPNDS